MESEARLSIFEAVSMIIGNSIGTGIIAVPYLAAKNSIPVVLVIAAAAYAVNVILHLIIAEFSLNNGGKQLVKCFEGELFRGRGKKIFSWILFAVYGLAIMIGVAGNINGGANIFIRWFHLPMRAAQILYYLLAGSVVFLGMKAVGIAQKYAVSFLIIIVAAMTIGTAMQPAHTLVSAPLHLNNVLALFSMVVFATSANQSIIQVVKGLNGDAPKIRKVIFGGFAIAIGFVLLVTLTVLIGVGGSVNKELAYLELGEAIGPIGVMLAGIFSLIALLTTFWTHTLALRDVVHEQIGTGNRISWCIATIPCILFALFGVNSFIVLTRLMSGVVVLLSLMLVITYGRSRKHAGASPICGVLGTMPFQAIMMIATVLCAVGSVIKLI
jgi:amino acid permease